MLGSSSVDPMPISRLRQLVAVGVIATLLATPLGLLFLGRIGVDALRPFTGIPISSRIVEPRSVAGMQIGFETPISLWLSCADGALVDFNGSFWRPANWSPADEASGEWFSYVAGKIRLIGPNRAVFVSDMGSELVLARATSPQVAPRCGYIELF